MDANTVTNDQHSADTEFFYGHIALDQNSATSQAVDNTNSAPEDDSAVTRSQVSFAGLGSTPNTSQAASSPLLSGSFADSTASTPTPAIRIRPRMATQLNTAKERQANEASCMTSRSVPQDYKSPEPADGIAQYKRRRADDGNLLFFAGTPSDTFRSDALQLTSTTTGEELRSRPAFITIDQKPREDDDDVPRFAAMPDSILNSAAIVAETSASSPTSADRHIGVRDNNGSISLLSADHQPGTTDPSSHSIFAGTEASPHGPNGDEEALGDLNMVSDAALSDIEDNVAMQSLDTLSDIALCDVEDNDVMQVEHSLCELDLSASGDLMLYDQDSEPERHDTVMGSDDTDPQDEDSDMTEAEPLPESCTTISQHEFPAVTIGRTSSRKLGTSQLRARHARLKLRSPNEATKSLKKALRDLQAEVDLLREEKAAMASQLTACRQRWQRCKKHSRKLQAENIKHKRSSHSSIACATSETRTSKPEMTSSGLNGSRVNQEPWTPFPQTSDAQRAWLDSMIIDADARREGEMIPRWLKYQRLAQQKARAREVERLANNAVGETAEASLDSNNVTSFPGTVVSPRVHTGH